MSGSGESSASRSVDVAGAAGGSATSDRKSTRLNSSHLVISYAVFCLKKKKKVKTNRSHGNECAGFGMQKNDLARTRTASTGSSRAGSRACQGSGAFPRRVMIVIGYHG